MKYLLLLTALAACHPAPPVAPACPAPAAEPTGYDAALATKLGADELGMHHYVLAFLKPGPKRDQPPEEAKRLMQAHLANIGRLAEARKLVLAGPFEDDGAFAGIYVFDVTTIAEATELTRTDPAIQAGRLEMELHPWYGSAALIALDPIHKRVQKKKLGE